MKKGIKYGLLVPGWIILGILLLVVVAGLLVQTPPAKQRITDIAEKQISRFINGNLTIGKTEGNFFTHLSLKNVVYILENDTIASIGEIKTGYNLWALWRQTLEIHSVEIIKPRIFLQQKNDSTWNFQQINKPGQKKEKTDTTGSGSFNIRLPIFQIEDGSVRIEAIDSVIPRKVENLNTGLSLFWLEKEQSLQLKQLSFNTFQPEFSLNQLEFVLNRNNNFIELKDFRLTTAQNQLRGGADYKAQPIKKGSADFETAELEMEEFTCFLPNLKFPARPIIKIDAGLNQDSTWATIEIKENDQQIFIQLASGNLEDFFQEPNETELHYTFNGQFENVELAHWLGNPDISYVLNGELFATGSGTDPATAQLKLSGHLNDWVIKDRTTGQVNFEFDMNRGNLAGWLNGAGNFGEINLKPNIQNLFAEPVYRMEWNTKNLNLANLTGIDSLYSNINMTGLIKGEEFDPEKIAAAAEISFPASQFQQFNLDTLFASVQYKNKNIGVDTLFVQTQSLVLSAKGNYSFTSNSDLRLSVEFSGLDDFSSWLPATPIQTSGKADVFLFGRPDSLLLKSSVGFLPTQYDGISMKSLNLDITGRLTLTDTLINAHLIALELTSGNLKVDSVTAQMEGSLDSVFVSASLAAKDFNTQIQTGIIPGEKTRFTLTEWRIDFKDQHWALQQPPAVIEFDSISYSVDNFMLISESAEGSQHILAGGKITRNGEENFSLEIGRADIGRLAGLFVPEQQVSGFLDVGLELTGTSDSLLLNTSFSLDKAAFNQYRFTEISGNMKYAKNRLLFEALVIPEDSGKIEVAAEFPLQVNLDTLGIGYNFSDSVSGKITASELSLGILETLGISEKISGFFETDVVLSGTVESPLVTGTYSLNDAAVNDYRFDSIGGAFNYHKDRFFIETLVVPQDSGKLELTATLPLHYNPDSIKLEFNPKDSVSGRLIVEKISLAILQAINPGGNIAGHLEGEVNISGTAESPNPEGNLRLVNASAEIKEYGIDYRDIGLDLIFLRDKISLDNFIIKSKDGSVTGKGQVDFASDFYKGDISQSEIKLDFNRFQPFNHRQFNMQVSGNASLGGKKGDVVYSGEITIPRAEIFIPAVLRMMGKMSLPEIPKPILVQEAEKLMLSADSVKTDSAIAIQPDTISFGYFDQFKGKLRIKIPRNTWIKNEDLYIEISGDVELIKNNEYFELFGTLDVVRGQYDILGKTFVIDDGTIRFQGGEKIAPEMDVNASYTFRNTQRVEQELSVNIKGKASAPEVHFKLNENAVSEGDALSYILFGKSMNELTIDEQDDATSTGGGTLAEKAAASLLSSQIAGFLGDKLNVDYIEVKSDGGFDNATVVVGKYITNDLFVSYQQKFGETDEKNIAKYEVKLEYELFRFLFFELNNSSNDSGFDVIIKFDTK